MHDSTKIKNFDTRPIEEEIEELRRRLGATTAQIEFERLDNDRVRLLKPGSYGIIRVEHDVDGNGAYQYLLRGSKLTDDGRFPAYSVWIRQLSRKRGAVIDQNGVITIPVNDQETANDVHSTLLPILGLALNEMHDPLRWPYSPETFIPVTELEDGTEVIEEGRYGQIILQHGLSGNNKSRERHLVYILGGYKTPNMRFPGNPDWNFLIYQSGIANYKPSRKQWKFFLEDPDKIHKINKLLIPLLKEAILKWHAISNDVRTRFIVKKIAKNLEERGVNLAEHGISLKNEKPE